MGFGTLKNKAKSFLGQYEQKDPVTYAAAQQAIGGLLVLDGFVGIDNPFEGKKRSGIFGTLFGIALGIVFMFVPSFMTSISGANSMTATTNAVVVAVTPQASTSSKGGTACSLTAQYTVAGNEYKQLSPVSSGNYCSLTAGQTISINYNPKTPGAWAYDLKSTNAFLSIFFWAGLLFAIVSFITFIIRLLSIIFGWKLLQSGRALAKTLPQGVSIGTLVEEIKQNFAGTLFNRGVANMPAMPFMQPVQQVPVAVSTPMSVVAPSPLESPVQQASVNPVGAVTTPQSAAPNNYSSAQAQQAAATVVPPTPLSPYEPGMGESTPSVVQPQPAQPVPRGDYPLSTPPRQ